MVQTIALRAYGLLRHPTDERTFTELQEGCPGLSQALEKLQSKSLIRNTYKQSTRKRDSNQPFATTNPSVYLHLAVVIQNTAAASVRNWLQ